MPTPAEIRDRLALAQGEGRLSDAERADLLDLAITEAIAQGLPYISASLGGGSESRMTVQDALATRDRLRRSAGGGIVAQYAEFTE